MPDDDLGGDRAALRERHGHEPPDRARLARARAGQDRLPEPARLPGKPLVASVECVGLLSAICCPWFVMEMVLVFTISRVVS